MQTAAMFASSTGLPRLTSMYTLPTLAPRGDPGSRWRLSESLRDWLQASGYRRDPSGSGGWVKEAPPDATPASPLQAAAEATRIFMLMRVADLLDAEAARLERDMREARAPVKTWMVLREGGGDLAAAGDRADWREDRALMTIYAYTELHALYLFLLDFTQPPSPDQPPSAVVPDDYHVPIADVLEVLAWDEHAGRWDLADATERLAAMDLGLYRLLPFHDICLNDEELRLARAGQAGQREAPAVTRIIIGGGSPQGCGSSPA